MLNDFYISKNFKLREFECKDGSQLVKIDSQLVAQLQCVRDKCKQPLIITSAYRSVSHNKFVGGSSDSQHLYGKAVDVRTPKGMTVDQFAKLGKECGFKGVGKYTWGCHFDVRTTLTEWDYR